MRQVKNSLLVFFTLVIAGCANTGSYSNVPVEDVSSRQGSVFEQSDYPTQPVSQPPYSEPGSPESDSATPDFSAPKYKTAPTHSMTNSAVIALLGSAEKQRQNGDYMNAAATLERAIRISPRDPELYYQLAQVRYLQRNYHQTEQLCRKAESLAAADKKLRENCRLLLEQL